jgi:hypothetical protein
MRWITAPIRFLWHVARTSWVSIDPALRPRSGASALKLFFFLIFFVVGLVLVLLGFDLDDVDRWLDAQGGWLDAIGTLAFRGLSGLILLICVGMVAGGVAQWFGKPDAKATRRAKLGRTQANGADSDDGRIGCLAMGIAAVIGYFAWFGMIG